MINRASGSVFRNLMSPAKRHRTALKTPLATICAFAPGFLFPIALNASESSEVAAAFLIAYSMTVAVNGIIGNSVELSAISDVSSDGDGDHIDLRSSAFRYLATSAFLTFAALLVIAPPLTWYFYQHLSDQRAFIIASLSLLPFPFFFTFSSVLSGLTIGSGHTNRAVITQLYRAAAPLLLVVTVTSPSLISVGMAFSVGELARILHLTLRLPRRSETPGHQKYCDTVTIRLSGTLWQALSTSVWQAVPISTRLLLASTGSSEAILAYELTERVISAISQFISTAFLLRMMSRWAAVRRTVDSLRADFRRLFVLSGTLSILTGIATTVVVVLLFRDDPVYSQALLWTLLLLAVVPASSATAGYTRILILDRRERTLPALNSASIAGSVLLSVVLSATLDATGVIVGVAIARLLTAFGFRVVASSRARDDIGRRNRSAEPRPAMDTGL